MFNREGEEFTENCRTRGRSSRETNCIKSLFTIGHFFFMWVILTVCL